MPTYVNRIGVQFDTSGASNYTRQIARAAESNVRYGRSLPIAHMRNYNKEIANTSNITNNFRVTARSMSEVLLKAERSSKTARLGFTRFLSLIHI